MLKQMKKYSDTFVVKTLLWLIGFSFVFFGFSKEFMGDDNIAIKVADKRVTVQELNEEVRRQIAQLQQSVGNVNFDYKQALKMGLLDQIVNNLVYRLLIDAETKDQGIYVSDEKIYEIVKNTKEFQDDKGNFSPEQFAYILSDNGVSEHQFISEVSNDISRQILVNSVMSNVDNSTLAEILYKNKNEKRIFDVVSFKVKDENIKKNPSEQELNDIYNINIDKFAQPEYRKISYITITPEMAMKFKDLKQNEDDRIYNTMIEMGENIIDEINGGANIDEIVKVFGVSRTKLPDLDVEGKKRDGSKFKDSVFSQKYRDIAFFALDEKGVSDVLDSDENIMLVVVDTVYPSQPKSFANVKSEVQKIWKKNAQIAQASEKLNSISSALTSGESFNSAVKKVDANANVILNTSSSRFNNLYTSDFLTKLFTYEIGKPFVSKSDDIYYVAVVRDIVIPDIKDKNDFEKFKTQEQINFANVIVDTYINYLYKKYGVEKNEKAILRVLN